MLLNINQKKFSIKLSLSVIFSLIVVTTTIGISIIFLKELSTTLHDDINTRIHDIASLGLSNIDVDLHDSLKNPEQEGTDSYNSIKKSLQQIRNCGSNIRYVYTLRRKNKDNYIFVVDGEESEELISHLGDKYNSINLEEFYTSENKIWIPENFYIDEWGYWMSGFAKIYSKTGKIVGILGIDVSANSIIERERVIYFRIGIIVALIIIFFIILGVILARKISKPLSILEKDMQQIMNLKLESSVPIRTIFKEIISIQKVEENMKVGLRSFKKYIPSDLVNQLLQNNIEAKLGGETKELTIFFSDIVNFTTISESMEPEQLAHYMNAYFEGLTKIIIEHNGTVDKYIGDAIMAFWGSPNEIDNHAFHASLAALECQSFLKAFNSAAELRNDPILKTRIGINSGMVVIGNFGYEDRMNYTAFGDNVNLAARLEGLNKQYGTNIIIGDSTYLAIKDKFATRKLDLVAVKGKLKGVFIYELIGLKNEISPIENNFLEIYNEGVNFYFNQMWAKSIEKFSDALLIKPNDLAIELMIYRCKVFLTDPPSGNWDGINHLKEK